MIAHKLMCMEGWKVYGYYEDKSDSMTDYWSPAHWDGIAEKNGYILCVNVYGAEEAQEIKEYNHTAFTYDKSIKEKIEKLEAMTVERGASEQEEESAKIMIKKLQKKVEIANQDQERYIIVDTIPGHMAHPPKMNWHIEKDGIIIAKGNGILKYSSIYDYYNYPRYMEDLNEYRQDKEAYAKKHTQDLLCHYYTEEEKAKAATQYHLENLEEAIRMIDKFESFINKIDTTCGGLLGEGDSTIYEKVTITKYKKELQVVETAQGSIKEGQLFILKDHFNYGRRKGLVYRIHETDYNGQKYYHAYKLNEKFTKECTGHADKANYWFVSSGEYDALTKWIEKGSIAWCELQEVKIPYEVEKIVKKTIKTEKKNNSTNTMEAEQTKTDSIDVDTYTYNVFEDTNTRTGEKIYIVRVEEKLSREEYIQVRQYINSLGGYYSRFKRGFIFHIDPSEKLGIKKLDQGNIENSNPAEIPTITEAAHNLKNESTISDDLTTKRKYYPINEETARYAKMVNSFSDYQSGEATKLYEYYCNKIYDILDKIKIEKPDLRSKAEGMADYYCRKLADYYNDYYRNEASCPSVMICGPANFPVRKKEKQNSRREKLQKTWEYLQNYANKINNLLILEHPILSKNENAVEMLQNKIDQLEQEKELMKDINKYYRKNKTIEGYGKEIPKELLEHINFMIKNNLDSYGLFSTTNTNAEIRRLKSRLEKLKKFKEQGTTNNQVSDADGNEIFKVVKNSEIMRLQLFFDEKPSEKVRDILKSNGFRWSPYHSAWQRQLTNNAIYHLKIVTEKIKEIEQPLHFGEHTRLP